MLRLVHDLVFITLIAAHKPCENEGIIYTAQKMKQYCCSNRLELPKICTVTKTQKFSVIRHRFGGFCHIKHAIHNADREQIKDEIRELVTGKL